MRPICFLSDFGLADDFVGTCKGVMLRISPEARVIDLTHQVPGFDIAIGAEVLQHATGYMPEDTVYLAVVDPGVGTKRRKVAVRARSGAHLVGPDNGLLVPASESLGGVASSVELTHPDFHVHPVSSTFHGRDVFAPAAAHLASGVALEEMGDALAPESLKRINSLDEGASGWQDGEMSIRIIDIDRFGNARLSVKPEQIDLSYGDSLKLDVGDGDMSARYVETFGASDAGELILVTDSHWRLSVAINKGNAAQALALSLGGRVHMKRPPGEVAR